jgi:hypothetical protein
MRIQKDLSFEGTDGKLARCESIADDIELNVPGELGYVGLLVVLVRGDVFTANDHGKELHRGQDCDFEVELGLEAGAGGGILG